MKVPNPLRLVVTEGMPITVHSAVDRQTDRQSDRHIQKKGMYQCALYYFMPLLADSCHRLHHVIPQVRVHTLVSPIISGRYLVCSPRAHSRRGKPQDGTL